MAVNDEPGPDEQLNDPGAARESTERERTQPTDGLPDEMATA